MERATLTFLEADVAKLEAELGEERKIRDRAILKLLDLRRQPDEVRKAWERLEISSRDSLLNLRQFLGELMRSVVETDVVSRSASGVK